MAIKVGEAGSVPGEPKAFERLILTERDDFPPGAVSG